ncbi:hypothetical protein AMECASPLE_014124, partial [Ameca splendens]
MGQLTLVTFLAVLCSVFMVTEANPFVYNYEGLRIGGLIITCLLTIGGIVLITYKKCTKRHG